MDDFIKRLRTFKLVTWMCKPKELSPIECAKRGYINTTKDTISCTHCGAYFNTSIYYESDLLQMHSEYCPLSVPMQLTYISLKEFSIKAYKERENTYSTADVLPCIISPFQSASPNQLSQIFPGFPKVYLKSIFALFGWSCGYERVYCELCGIVIECSRKEYALVRARNLYNLQIEKNAESKLVLRHGIEITLGKKVDLASSHRYYCPWINDVTHGDFSYFTNDSDSENIGWKIVFNGLLVS